MTHRRYKTYCYWFERCPRHWECNDRSWWKANFCQSTKSEDDARNKLFNHFMDKTTKHSNQDKMTLWTSAAEAEIEKAVNNGGCQNDGQVDSPLVCDGLHMRPLKWLVIADISHAGSSCIAMNRNIYRHVISGHPHIDIHSAQQTFANIP